jgi:hypothetical protein
MCHNIGYEMHQYLNRNLDGETEECVTNTPSGLTDFGKQTIGASPIKKSASPASLARAMIQTALWP